MNTFPSLSHFESAYRKFHSTETALLRIHNDLLQSINTQKVSALILLDLSAAFDTIDHNILLTRLQSNFGISGTALSLLSSYLTNRSQSVLIGNHSSSSSPLLTGVPQGSVLGPLLFCLYTSPLSHIFSNSPVSYHLYADDTQLYISFSSSDSAYNLTVLSSTLDSVYSWFTLNRLSVNPSKTEFLLVGTPQQRSKLTATSVSFCGTVLTPSDSCRNLGVVFDSDLSFKKHISNVCRLSFYHIRQLRQIRSSLYTNSAIILSNALVSSKLDYCNSLYYKLPACSINRLQVVQNALARVVVPFVKRSHHMSPTLRHLHWLPIKQRIDYKIASLTFKTLHFNQPSYLAELFITETPRSLRSFSQHKLKIPLLSSLNKVNVPLLLLHLLSGDTLCLLTFALFVLLLLHFMLFLKTHFFSSVVNLFFGLVFWLMACMCLTLLGSLIWLYCVGGMVLLVLAAKASLMLSFDCEMDDKP